MDGEAKHQIAMPPQHIKNILRIAVMIGEADLEQRWINLYNYEMSGKHVGH